MPETDHLDKALEDVEAAVRKARTAASRDHKTPLLNEREMVVIGDHVVSDKDALNWYVFSGDINDFKNLNSKLEYDGADLVLHAVGSALDDLREHSIGFRRGGDEFVLVGLEKDAILQGLQNLCPLDVPVEGHGVQRVTTSFGYAKIDPNQTFRENLERADRACKAAKWKHDGTPVEWTPHVETGYSGRHRCPNCRSQVSISVPPEMSRNLPTLKCMVCGDNL